jgi:glycosyltransferase involved in cell wall biosynthesis
MPERLQLVRSAHSAAGSAEPRAFAISVVVPTYRRPQWLERCLRALLAQNFSGRYEIVVADDEASPLTEAAVMRLSRDFPNAAELRYVAVTATQGPAGARNCGWRIARGDIIAFTDDDTIPAYDWLSCGAAAMAGSRIAVGGRVKMPIPEKPTDYQLNESGLGEAEFVTANCFVRRSALVEVGGFDERFTAAWREDSDLQFMLMRRYGEHSVGRADAAVVVHPLRPAHWGISLSQQRKSLFDALLFKKHPTLYRRRIRPNPPWDYYLNVIALLAGLALLALNQVPLAAAALALWLLLSLRFCIARLRRTTRRPGHVAEMLLTSVAIPPVALLWRLLGAWRFRVWFL